MSKIAGLDLSFAGPSINLIEPISPGALPEVAPFNIVGTPRDGFSSTLGPNNVEDGTPDHRARSIGNDNGNGLGVGGGICNLQSAICNS